MIVYMIHLQNGYSQTETGYTEEFFSNRKPNRLLCLFSNYLIGRELK